MTTPTLDSFFSAGGGKSVSWKDKPVGTTVSGTITMVHPPTQVTDYITKEPKFKKDGSPVLQVRIDLATTEREDNDDDGVRSLYSSGWMTGAIGEAIRKATGTPGAPQVGGTLTVRLSERAPSDTPGLTYNKYDAHYVPPSPAAGFFAEGAPQQGGALPPLGGQAAPQQPVPQPSINGTGYVQPPAQAPLGAPAPAAAPPAAAGPLSPEQIAAIMAGSAPAAPAAAPPAEPEPARPEQMNEAAWNQLDLASKKQVAATFSQLPPF